MAKIVSLLTAIAMSTVAALAERDQRAAQSTEADFASLGLRTVAELSQFSKNSYPALEKSVQPRKLR